ncbi:unnamed protein product, partial [Rotaria magnacalcarata]
MEKQQQLKCPQKSPSNKNLSMHHRLAGWPSSGQ